MVYLYKKKQVIVKHSDNDGLSDENEEKIGTNLSNPDTDGDGIIDGEEEANGTDPTNVNTDGDRLYDADDPEPTKNNSAFVRVTVSKIIIEEDSALIAALLTPIADKLDPNTEVATITVDLEFDNIGDDFTSYVKVNSILHTGETEIKEVRAEIERLEVGEKVSESFTYNVKLSDIPPNAVNDIIKHIAKGNHPVFSFTIKSVNFERF